MRAVSEVQSRGELQGRGISAATVRRGVLTRFLPGSVGGVAVLGAAVAMGARSFGLSQLLVLGVGTAGLTLGYGLGLTALRRFLYPDAAVAQRRSLVAGLCSPLYLGLVSIFTQGSNLFEIGGLSVLTGAAVGLGLFFPWLTRTPGEGSENTAASAEGKANGTWRERV